MPNRRSLLTAAQSAAARGWHVFPLRPDDKRPAFPDHAADRCTHTDPRCQDGHTGWEPRATTDPDRIARAWHRAPYGIGIACGPSGLLVVDLDVPKPGQATPPSWRQDGVRDGADVFAMICARHDQDGAPALWNTYTVRTASGGWHLYLTHPGGPALRNTTGERGNGLGWLVDTRAHGGYVVAAGSTVDGRPYEVFHDAQPAATPSWLTGLLRPEPARSLHGVPGDVSAYRLDAYVRGAIDRTAAHLAAAPGGERNHALYMAAQSLGQLVAGGGLTEAAVIDALTATARAIGLTDREIACTIRSGLLAGASRPRTAAA